jgi:hypothetical protein
MGFFHLQQLLLLLCFSNGKYRKKQSIDICPTKHIISIFKLGRITAISYSVTV